MSKTHNRYRWGTCSSTGMQRWSHIYDDFDECYEDYVQAMKRIRDIGANLARHGSSFDHVVQCTVALADIADWPAFNEVYRGYFGKHFPARMAYATGGLALGAKVEVQCNAVIGK